MMKRLSVLFLIFLVISGGALFAQEDFEEEVIETEDDVVAAEEDIVETGEEAVETVETLIFGEEEEEAEQMEASRLNPEYSRAAISVEDNGSVFINSDVYFRLSSEDEGTGVQYIEYSIDNGVYMEYNSPFNILTEGNHIISYRAIDNGENIEQPKTYQVVVDNSSPAVSLESDRKLYEERGTLYCSPETQFYISAEEKAEEVGVELTYGGYNTKEMYSAGNGERKQDNFFNMEGEKEVVYYYTAMDKVGNLSDVRQFRVLVDRTAPEASLTGSTNLKRRNGEFVVIPSTDLMTDDGRYLVSNTTRLGFEAQDDLSGVKAIYVKVNEEEYIEYHKPIELADSEDYTILVKTEDNVGNVSEAVEFLFKVDFVEPESTLDMVDGEGTDL